MNEMERAQYEQLRQSPFFGMQQMGMVAGPLPCLSEPKIGPGLLLERGRTRIVVNAGPDRQGDFKFGSFHRCLWCDWPVYPSADEEADKHYFRYLLASGFRVIRGADPVAEEASDD